MFKTLNLKTNCINILGTGQSPLFLYGRLTDWFWDEGAICDGLRGDVPNLTHGKWAI